MAQIRAGNRRDQAIAGALTTPRLADQPKSRTCPRCEAIPGRPCRRWIGGRVAGQDIGGGYWRTLKRVHDERKRSRSREAS